VITTNKTLDIIESIIIDENEVGSIEHRFRSHRELSMILRHSLDGEQYLLIWTFFLVAGCFVFPILAP
jgi:hypothetical protein